MANQIISQVVNTSKLSSSDKKALLGLFNAQADDIEALRASVAAVCAKLDAAGAATVAALGTTNVATVAIGPGKLSVKK